jgi:peptidoglycan hydrolase-like protein with peptidoglycan-binding domain
MAEYDDDGNEIQDTEDQGTDPEWLKNTRKKARLADAAIAERDAAKRELMLMKAGIDLETPHGRLFAKGYDGEITVEAVKAAATDYGLLTPTTPEPTPEELAALRQFDSAGQAGSEGSSVEEQAMDALNKVSYFGSDGQWNPEGKDQILAALKSAGLDVSYDQPGNVFQIPGTNPIPT